MNIYTASRGDGTDYTVIGLTPLDIARIVGGEIFCIQLPDPHGPMLAMFVGETEAAIDAEIANGTGRFVRAANYKDFT